MEDEDQQQSNLNVKVYELHITGFDNGKVLYSMSPIDNDSLPSPFKIINVLITETGIGVVITSSPKWVDVYTD